jgi:hypothetical protein
LEKNGIAAYKTYFTNGRRLMPILPYLLTVMVSPVLSLGRLLQTRQDYVTIRISGTLRKYPQPIK